MKNLTLSFLFKDGQILLAMKKRGFGDGKWNGYGGKLEEGESVEEAAVREILEEGNVKVVKEDLEHFGTIDFHFTDKPDWDQKVFIYKTVRWEGEPEETEEMKPRWFSFDEIPFDKMWAGDDIWLKKVINGEKVFGEIYFEEGGKKLGKVDLK